MAGHVFVSADLLENLGKEFDSMAHMMRKYIDAFVLNADIGSGYGPSEVSVSTTSHYNVTTSRLIEYLNSEQENLRAHAYKLNDAAKDYQAAEDDNAALAGAVHKNV